MQYNELSAAQKTAACQDIWKQLTKAAGSEMITIAWSRMSVEEAILDQTSGEVDQTPEGWKLSPDDFKSIERLVEHPPGPEEYSSFREMEEQSW